MVEKMINEINFTAASWPPDREKSTLLFLHGSGNSRRLWNRQVEGLAGDANTVALDLPGHGKSPGEGVDSVSGYSEIVKGFIAAAGLERVVPCGLSLGGAIALQMLLDSPEKYPGAVLVNSGARLRVLPAIFETIRNHYEGYVSSLAAMSASEKSDKEMLREIIEDARACHPEVVLKDFSACNHFDVMERLGEIKAPVLVLSADEDRLTPLKYGTFLKDRLSASSHVIIKEAGHMSPAEKPAAVNGAIRDFVESL